MCRFFCPSLELSTFPIPWRHVVRKFEHPLGSNNYRPVCLLPVISKVFGIVSRDQLRLFVDREGLLRRGSSGSAIQVRLFPGFHVVGIKFPQQTKHLRLSWWSSFPTIVSQILMILEVHYFCPLCPFYLLVIYLLPIT